MVTDTATVSPSRFVQLLADEQRWRLLQELARSDRKVSELTELVGRPQNLVSYHLASLRNAGIVSARRSSADRRDTYYRIEMRRCADLLCGVGPGSPARPAPRRGRSADPGWAPASAAAKRALPLHRKQRSLSNGRGASRASLRRCDPGSQRGQPSEAVASQCGACDGRTRDRHLDAHDQAHGSVQADAIRPGHHALRQGSGDLPAVSRGRRRPLTGACPIRRPRVQPTKRATRRSGARPRSSNRGSRS